MTYQQHFTAANDTVVCDDWLGQLEVLASSVDAKAKRMVLYTMDAIRLFETALASHQHCHIVSDFLEFLAVHGPEEHEVSVHPDTDTAASSVAWQSQENVASGETGSHLAGINDLPTEIGLTVLGELSYAARTNLRGVCRNTAALVSEGLRTAAARLLLRFHLRLVDVRLMLTATESVICGSMVTALTRPHHPFVPGDLDFATGVGRGAMVVDFLMLLAEYELTQDSVEYQDLPGIGRMWTLLLRLDVKINVLESLSSNPLDTIASFHLSCVHGALLPAGLWHAYPGLTSNGVAFTTPSQFPTPPTAARSRSAWSVLHKYEDRGFSLHFNECPIPHRCGWDVECPATLRTSDDAGCSFTPFPDWYYSSDAVAPAPICWSMRGTGCPRGILLRPGGPLRRASAVADDGWYTVMDNLLASPSPPE
ncbi:hypothetical protein C8R46DRAFT_1212605 [Mycena filopes]|nr:hypothetical protein C8R46DRAFT_1212605 [Mycena filopes]